MILYGNWFSPFVRKVAFAIEQKRLDYDFVDGLALGMSGALHAHNPRGEVPLLMDGSVTISNSADILAYLDHAYPSDAAYPDGVEARVQARALERMADTLLDAILVDCSLWTWAERHDEPPPGLFEAGQADLENALDSLEWHLRNRASTFAFGPQPGVVEFAYWPHLSALKPLGFSLPKSRFPAIIEWLKLLRPLPLFQQDLERTRTFLRSMRSDTHERRRIFWRGDRIEWLLSRGFHEWFVAEIEGGRVIWPFEAV
jgi:glutathione S-transferase